MPLPLSLIVHNNHIQITLYSSFGSTFTFLFHSFLSFFLNSAVSNKQTNTHKCGNFFFVFCWFLFLAMAAFVMWKIYSNDIPDMNDVTKMWFLMSSHSKLITGSKLLLMEIPESFSDYFSLLFPSSKLSSSCCCCCYVVAPFKLYWSAASADRKKSEWRNWNEFKLIESEQQCRWN